MNLDTLKAMYLNFHKNNVNDEYISHFQSADVIPCDIILNSHLGLSEYNMVGLYFITKKGDAYDATKLIDDEHLCGTFLFEAIPIFMTKNKEGFINILGIDIKNIDSIKFIEYD